VLEIGVVARLPVATDMLVADDDEDLGDILVVLLVLLHFFSISDAT
jgi:hypothetical protein